MTAVKRMVVKVTAEADTRKGVTEKQNREKPLPGIMPQRKLSSEKAKQI